MKRVGWVGIVFLLILIYRVIDWYKNVGEHRIGERVWEEGCLRQDSELRNRGQKVSLGEWEVWVEEEERLWAGDCLAVEGRLDDFENEGGNCDGKCWLVAEKVEIGKENEWYRLIGDFRRRLVGVIRRALPKREADLVVGMVLGVKGGMDSEFYEALRRTGTLHIVVASGSNVALVAGSIVGLLSFVLGRKFALVAGMVLIWFYAFLSGFDIPIIRAGIMASILFLGQGLGRKFEVGRALIVAVIGMVIWNPGVIREVSFQLSVGAMVGVLIAREGRGWKGELERGWWVFLVVWPLIAVNFWELQWAGVGVNMLVMGVVGEITILGMMGAVLGLVPVVGIWLSRMILWIAYPLTWYFSQVVSFLGQVRWLSVELKVNWLVVVGYYFILIWWIFDGKLRKKKV
jgi:ComEC/Rec2-related protein